MTIKLMEALALGQLENSEKKLTKLAQEALELSNRLLEIDRRIILEVQERDRLRSFLFYSQK